MERDSDAHPSLLDGATTKSDEQRIHTLHLLLVFASNYFVEASSFFFVFFFFKKKKNYNLDGI
jgi:hypothetical protein